MQEELTPWTNAFETKHQRKPTLGDVQATGTPCALPSTSASPALGRSIPGLQTDSAVFVGVVSSVLSLSSGVFGCRYNMADCQVQELRDDAAAPLGKHPCFAGQVCESGRLCQHMCALTIRLAAHVYEAIVP